MAASAAERFKLLAAEFDECVGWDSVPTLRSVGFLSFRGRVGTESQPTGFVKQQLRRKRLQPKRIGRPEEFQLRGRFRFAERHDERAFGEAGDELVAADPLRLFRRAMQHAPAIEFDRDFPLHEGVQPMLGLQPNEHQPAPRRLEPLGREPRIRSRIVPSKRHVRVDPRDRPLAHAIFSDESGTEFFVVFVGRCGIRAQARREEIPCNEDWQQNSCRVHVSRCSN